MSIEISTAAFTTVRPLENVRLIVATDLDGAIGKDNDLPWGNIPGDLPRFKILTTGTTLIMGRKAFESLPGLLPGRDHYVLTSNVQEMRRKHRDKRNLQFFGSVKTILSAIQAQPHTTFFIAGGADIYRQFLPYVSLIFLTTVWDKVEADVYSKEFKPGSSALAYFRSVNETFVLAKDDHGRVSHAYRTFVRRKSRYDSLINRWKMGRNVKRLDKTFK